MRKIIVSGFLGQDATKQISKQNREYVTLPTMNTTMRKVQTVDLLLVGLELHVLILTNCHLHRILRKVLT